VNEKKPLTTLTIRRMLKALIGRNTTARRQNPALADKFRSLSE